MSIKKTKKRRIPKAKNLEDMFEEVYYIDTDNGETEESVLEWLLKRDKKNNI